MVRILLLLTASAMLTCPIGAEETPKPLSIGLTPAISFPLGEDAKFFSIGGGADIGVSYRFPGAPLLSLGGGIGYGLLPVDLDTAVSVLSLGAGADGDLLTMEDNDWHLNADSPPETRQGGRDGAARAWGYSTDKDDATRTNLTQGPDDGPTNDDAGGWSIGAYEQD